jgi:hypothetical protein
MEANKKIRCVNTKTKEVRWISANVANNAGFRKKYKWQIEELPAAKEEPKRVQLPEPKEPETDPISQEEEFADIPAVVIIDEASIPAHIPLDTPDFPGEIKYTAVQEEKKPRKPRTTKKKNN